jgi:Sulfotransferase family
VIADLPGSRRARAAMAQALASVLPRTMEARVGDVVLFVGCGRSGTNVLARLLDTHPEVAVYPHEANELWHPGLYPWFRSLREVPPIWRDAHAFTAASVRGRTAADDRRLKAVLGSYRTLHRARYVMNKSVLITFMIPRVLEIFPDARFIHLVRDGRAAAHSFAKMERRKIDRRPEPYRERGLDLPFDQLLDDFARHWQDHISELEAERQALKLDGQGRIHELHYEDLCADPERELAELARFLDLDPAGFRLDGGRRGPIENQNHKFREELDAETIERITALTEPQLSLKGYGD